MKSPRTKIQLLCTCGCRDFAVAARTRSSAGRLEHHLCCKSCGQLIAVDKSTFALYNYLEQRRPSAEFLRLFDLG
jgi:hypothetical protein